MKLDGATFLIQWATGGLGFCAVTTRGREVGIGYGWLLRSVYVALAAGGVVVAIGNGLNDTSHALGVLTAIAMAMAGVLALGVSVRYRTLQTFDPRWDWVAPLFGVASLVVAAMDTGAPFLVALLRLVVGAAFLGCISDSMLLGHWYLVQPGLRRDSLKQLVRWNAWLWPIEVAALLIPTGMVSALNGHIDDGYNGLLGWVWVVSAITTIGLVGVTWLALREQYYSAVMSATGLLYLAILTAFGTDLVARAILS